MVISFQKQSQEGFLGDWVQRKKIFLAWRKENLGPTWSKWSTVWELIWKSNRPETNHERWKTYKIQYISISTVHGSDIYLVNEEVPCCWKTLKEVARHHPESDEPCSQPTVPISLNLLPDTTVPQYTRFKCPGISVSNELNGWEFFSGSAKFLLRCHVQRGCGTRSDRWPMDKGAHVTIWNRLQRHKDHSLRPVVPKVRLRVVRRNSDFTSKFITFCFRNISKWRATSVPLTFWRTGLMSRSKNYLWCD